MATKWEDASLGSENRARLNELIKIVDYRNCAKFTEYRFIDDLVPYLVQWLPIYKEGKPVLSKSSGKPVRIPFNVTNFNPETGKTDDTKPCPFIEAAEKIAKYIKDEDELKQLRPSRGYYAQAINRKLQENPDKKGKASKAERASGFIAGMDSEAFTPVEVHQLNYSIEQGIKTANELNTVRIKGQNEKVAKPVADPKYGADILIKFDKNEKGTAKYKVQKGERTPLDPEKGEDKLLLWDITSAIKETTLSRKDAKIEAERIVTEFMKSVKKGSAKNDSPDEDDSDLPDDIEASPSPKKSSKDKKKKGKEKDSPVDSPDDEDSPDLSSPDGEDSPDSPSPKKSSKDKKKPSSKDKKKKEDSPEDDSPDADSPDSPSPKKSSKDKKKSSSKDKKKKEDSPEDEDDDSPEFDLDEDDED